MSADVVGLQEIDRLRARSGSVDQAAVIAQELGWHHHFHVAMQQADGHYGDAIISRYPLTLKRAVELPGTAPWYCRETRGAACVTAETHLGAVDVVNTHFGLGRRERWLQAQLLTSDEWMSGTDAPLVLLGDFNSLGWSRPFRLLGRRLRNVRSLIPATKRVGTFPTAWPIIALDHVFVSPTLHPTRVAAHRTALARVASDHYPLVVDLELTPALITRSSRAKSRDPAA